MTQDSVPILYTFRRCPYAMRARLALYSAQINHQHREIDLKNKSQSLLDASSKGTVPVLVLTDGSVIAESLDIMHWALPDTRLDSAMQSLILENDASFKKALDRYKYPGRYDEEAGVNYRTECSHFIEKLVPRVSPFLNGADVSFLDFAIFPFIRQFANVDPDHFCATYPKLVHWLDLIGSSRLVDQVMTKYAVWEDSQDPVLITF